MERQLQTNISDRKFKRAPLLSLENPNIKRVIINSFFALTAAAGSVAFRPLPQTETPKEEFRFCGFSENLSNEGLQEFYQIINVGFNLNEQTGMYEAYNLGEPGSRGYIYPNGEGKIEPGNKVSGYYPVCEVQMDEPGVELFFYHQIQSQENK
ncbi:MAG TPA: hypothetical protein VKC53_04025 [Patescibacteria group bacterium]|nr:hypothetical protein [Patescibacteria group bacterium]